MRTLYLDMDGVLADFDKRAAQILKMPSKQFEDLYGSKVFWFALGESPGFFDSFDPMPDAHDLFAAAFRLCGTVKILTGLPRGEWAEAQKRAWAARYFGAVEVICCPSKDKSLYCKPGDILVDDRTEYRHLWLECGGHYIVHTDARTSILALETIV